MKHLAAVLSNVMPEYQQMADEVRREVSSFYQTQLQALTRTFDDGAHARSNYYDYYPFLFRKDFPTVSDAQLKVIAVSGVLYLNHLLLVDNIVDTDALEAYHYPLLSSLLHEQAILRLTPLFRPDSCFWDCLSTYHRDFASATLAEKRIHFRRICSYTKEEFFRIASGKAGVSKAACAALAILSNSPERLDWLSRTQDLFNAALQMYDDVKDWKDDYARGNYSYLITRALTAFRLPPDVPASEMPDTDALGNHLYYSGHVEEALTFASAWCTEALEGLDRQKVAGWIQVVQKLRSQIELLRDDFGQIRVRMILRSKGFLAEGMEAITKGATRFLMEQHAAGYPEAQHRMGFISPAEPVEGRVHSGCVFQRAIIADVLLDLRDRGLLAESEAIPSELAYLIQSRLTHVRGGWNYFPTLRNLPPDADDLGQILQVLVRGGYPSISNLVDDDIHLLFDKNGHDDGSFETWIVDRGASDENTALFVQAISDSWGDGPDVEVVANMAYGLRLYDPSRFSTRIQRAAEFVESKQTEAGNWLPTWYGTTFYGSYVSTRLLGALESKSPSLARAADFILKAQRQDGGFGDKCSTPLETALALLMTAGPLKTTREWSTCRKRALNYLKLAAADDYTWGASVFIQMDANRARRSSRGYRPNILTYSSRTLTTAFVLKALLTASDI